MIRPIKIFALIFTITLSLNINGQNDSLVGKVKNNSSETIENVNTDSSKEKSVIRIENESIDKDDNNNDTLKDYILPFTSLILAIVALMVTIFIYRNQNKRDQTEKTLEFSRRHETFDFYIQVLSPVWKMSIKWKYLPDEDREKYRRVVAMGWIGFESQKPEEILKNWIPDFKKIENFVDEHYLKKLNIHSQTEHEALTMYIHFWSEFWQAVEQGLINEKLCFALSQQYEYHKDFFRELREYIKQLKINEFIDEELPIWISYNEKIENFFMNLKNKKI